MAHANSSHQVSIKPSTPNFEPPNPEPRTLNINSSTLIPDFVSFDQFDLTTVKAFKHALPKNQCEGFQNCFNKIRMPIKLIKTSMPAQRIHHKNSVKAFKIASSRIRLSFRSRSEQAQEEYTLNVYTSWFECLIFSRSRFPK